jgi:hypothetical protein
LVISGLFVILFRERELPNPQSWPAAIRQYEHPLTDNVRVVDSETGLTIFWYSQSTSIRPKSVTKINGNWEVEFIDIK